MWDISERIFIGLMAFGLFRLVAALNSPTGERLGSQIATALVKRFVR